MIPMFVLHSRFTANRSTFSIKRNPLLFQLLEVPYKTRRPCAFTPFAMSDTRDFSASPTMTSPTHVAFDIETGKRPSTSNGRHKPSSIRSDPDGAPPSPMLRRRQTRANTGLSFKTVDVTPLRPSWHPGQEPGLDPSKPNGGRPHTPDLHEECQITVVDFSEDNIDVHDFDNTELINFIAKPQESWIKCRWINVNGLSWDVIQALGQHKKLHRLAIEDLTNTNNRTKADW
jgi:hypothetical protein